jgi:hypothetical protein
VTMNNWKFIHYIPPNKKQKTTNKKPNSF